MALLAVGLASQGDILLAQAWRWPALFPVAMALLVTHFLLWLYVLSRIQVTVAVPLTAVGYLFNALLVQFELGEQVSPRVWLGTAIIMAGVVLVTGRED